MNRVKCVEGLVFAVPLSEGSWGFGQIIARQRPIFYMAGLDVVRAAPTLKPEDLAQLTPIFLGNFFDVMIKNSRWPAVCMAPIKAVPFPVTKIKIGDCFFLESWDRKFSRQATPEEVALHDYRTNFGPILLELALKSHFGFQGPVRDQEKIAYHRVASVSIIEPDTH